MPKQEQKASTEKVGKFNFSKIIDKSIEFVFSSDNRKWVLLIFVLGSLLRALTALRAESPGDEMVYATYSIGFLDSGKLQPYTQFSVWYLLTDLCAMIFKSTLFGFRFLTILVGSLTILLLYLLGKEIFNEKIGLIAAFIFAFSPFQLVQMVALMDIPMTFFALFAIYLLVLFLKTDKKYLFALSWISLGTAIMIKSIALLFIPAFVIFLLCYNKKHHDNYRIKQIVYAALIIILMVAPVLTYNYLLFKDKGITDIQFARFTQKGMGPYTDIAATVEPFTLNKAFISYSQGIPGIVLGLKTLFDYETMLSLIFAIAGLFFLFKEKNKFAWLLILSLLFPHIFLAGTSLLANHMSFWSSFIALFSSIAVYNLSEKIQKENIKKLFIYSVLILILILSLAKVYNEPYINGYFGQNHIGKLIEFKNANIEPNSLVIVDSRIYRGRIVFMFHDRHYLESSYFPEVLSRKDSFLGQNIQIPTYFIEAVTDDSGWGTIKDQPDFNQSTEAIVNLFSSQAELIETIDDIWGKSHFNIYKIILPFKSSTLSYADSTHMWFYYPVGYKPVTSNFDYYEVYNTFDVLLDKLAHLILYIDLISAPALIIYLLYLFDYKKLAYS